MSEPGAEAHPSAEPQEHSFEQAEQSPAMDPINSQIAAGVDAANAAAANSAVLPQASLEQVIAQAAGLAMLNAVSAQQNAYVTANATVAAVVARILSAGPPAPTSSKADHV
jgi:hypothetical protein